SVLLLRYDFHAPPAALELDDAVGQGEQRVVLAAADVPARVVPRAALPHDDAPGAHGLPAVDLDPQPLGIRLAAVARRALAFLVSHLPTSSLSEASNRRSSLRGGLVVLRLGRQARHVELGAAVDPLRRRHELDLARVLVVAVAQPLERQ